jgi:hypothetical protein
MESASSTSTSKLATPTPSVHIEPPDAVLYRSPRGEQTAARATPSLALSVDDSGRTYASGANWLSAHVPVKACPVRR